MIFFVLYIFILIINIYNDPITTVNFGAKMNNNVREATPEEAIEWNNNDYFIGMKFDPLDGNGKVGAQSGVKYTWVIENGGTKLGNTVQHNFVKDGLYEVTMYALINNSTCECSKTKSVIMNRASAKSFETTGVAAAISGTRVATAVLAAGIAAVADAGAAFGFASAFLTVNAAYPNASVVAVRVDLPPLTFRVTALLGTAVFPSSPMTLYTTIKSPPAGACACFRFFVAFVTELVASNFGVINVIVGLVAATTIGAFGMK